MTQRPPLFTPKGDRTHDKQTSLTECTFAILTTPANGLVATIHDRMPAILSPQDYDRWLGDEPDPRDLLRPFPSGPMTIWPISTRVNSPSNDGPELLDKIELAKEASATQGD